MKYYILILLFNGLFLSVVAQPDPSYPNPEFSNEISLYQKDNTIKLSRLEKGNSKMDTKVKMMGMGGAENAYTLEGEHSPVRLTSGKSLSFIFTMGTSSTSSSPQSDSMMRANGMDPSMMQGFSMMDPANMITLYEAEPVKGYRKVYMMKTGGMLSMGKNKSSDKFTLSVKKIRDGYWLMLVDKNLPKGEYAFSVMATGMGAMDGSVTLYAFGID